MKGYLRVILVVFCTVVIACEEEQETVSAALPIEVEDTVFISIPGGTFVNSTGETVGIQSFQLQKVEVNNRLYRYLADQSGLPHPADPGFPEMDGYFYEFSDYPVVNVSPGKAETAASLIGARLPTRNEWEYAASLGLTGNINEQYPWGALSSAEVPGVPANYMALNIWEQRDLDGFMYTAPGGSYPLSNGGLVDMAGNVAEMVFCVADSSIHIMGGSWAQVENAMTLGFIRQIGHGDITWYTGFRMAK
ncbi:MAG: SUMF1/EgtB/PvdO family nonheme iron enzyme [Candidatus Sabulitectum sp.]|nr:SUMF1/EgtB/PvdO family nonheme iron enzyme [Candidatus Sabulitectum sp.]